MIANIIMFVFIGIWVLSLVAYFSWNPLSNLGELEVPHMTTKVYLLSFFQYFLLYFLGYLIVAALRGEVFSYNSKTLDYYSNNGFITTGVILSFIFTMGTLLYYTLVSTFNNEDQLKKGYIFTKTRNFLPLGTFGGINDKEANAWNNSFATSIEKVSLSNK